MNQLFVCVVLVSACVVAIHAIRCYQCAYVNPDIRGVTFDEFESCKDPFDTTGARVDECDGTCVKVFLEEDEKLVALVRGCIPNILLDCSGSECETAPGINTCVHCCNTDLCNGAGSVTFNLMMTTAMLVFTLTFACTTLSE